MSVIAEWGPVIAIGISSPALLAVISGWQRRSEKREDWHRQDSVADKLEAATKAAAAEAKQAAADLLKSNQKVAAEVVKVAEVASTTAAATDEKLDGIQKQGQQIHVLVNSRLTEANDRALAATEAQLSLLERLAPDAMNDIAALRKIVDELKEQSTLQREATVEAEKLNPPDDLSVTDALKTIERAKKIE